MTSAEKIAIQTKFLEQGEEVNKLYWNNLNGIPKISIVQMGFSSTTTEGDIRRFYVRWRLACSFNNIDLIGYKNATANSYTNLTRVFFTFTAFERFAKVMKGGKWYDCTELIEEKDIVVLYELFEKLNKNGKFLEFLTNGSSEALIERLDKLKNGYKGEILAVAAAMRHKFSHGHLSGLPQGVLPMNEFSFKISLVLLETMIREFSKKVNSIETV